MHRRTTTALSAAVLVLAGGCASSPDSSGPQSDPTQEIVFEGATAIPSSSTQDWVTYGDFAVRWTAVSETRLPPTAEEVSNGEGTIGREVTVKIDKVLWARKGGPVRKSLPSTMKIVNGGWVFHGTNEQPFRIDGQLALTPGQQYLAVLAHTDLSLNGENTKPAGKEWIALDYLPFDGTEVASTGLGDTKKFSARAKLAGRTASSSAATLDETSPDPLAKSAMDLDPVQRYQKTRDIIDARAGVKPGRGPGER